MALTKADLQAIQALFEPMNTRFDGIDTRLDSLEENQVIIRRFQLKVELEQYPRITVA